jgi:hypothetical protein
MRLTTPIFIVSSERSGTNLLRVLLDNHSEIHGPRAPQLLKTFSNAFPHYIDNGVLDDKKIWEDLIEQVNHPFIDWQVKIDQPLKEGATNFLYFWDIVYDLKVRSTEKKYIACKENNLFDYLFELKTTYPKAKFIYLHRDVRDVCASWMKVPNGFKNISSAAQNWNKEQLKCIRAQRTFGLEMCAVSYEDLISDTPSVMKGVLDFIGVKVEPACFDTDKEKGKDVDWNVYWQNLGKGVMKENSKKYLKEFDVSEIQLIESRARESMKLLGYSRDTLGNWEAPKQPALFRLISRLAWGFAKPKYKNKLVRTTDKRLEDFSAGIKRINSRRWE